MSTATQSRTVRRLKRLDDRVEEIQAQDENPYGGLCRTCRRAPQCTFPRAIDRPVMHCDEFDGIRPLRERLTVTQSQAPQTDRGGSPPPRPSETPLKGLCRYCARRDTCTYPKPEGGIWHCDEFE
jgi:hypothetical protein